MKTEKKIFSAFFFSLPYFLSAFPIHIISSGLPSSGFFPALPYSSQAIVASLVWKLCRKVYEMKSGNTVFLFPHAVWSDVTPIQNELPEDYLSFSAFN